MMILKKIQKNPKKISKKNLYLKKAQSKILTLINCIIKRKMIKTILKKLKNMNKKIILI
jgi:hypothetical protein